MEMFLNCAAVRKVGLHLCSWRYCSYKMLFFPKLTKKPQPTWREKKMLSLPFNESKGWSQGCALLFHVDTTDKANEGCVLCAFETCCFHCLRFGLPRGVAAFPGTGVFSIVGELRFSWWHFIQDTREPASSDGDQEGQQRSGSVCSSHVRQIGSCLRKSRDIWDGQFAHVPYGLYILDSMFIGFQCLSRQNVRNAFPSCQFNWDFSQIFS